jgi:putative DNA-invertase from lambdoid prophage Rac
MPARAARNPETTQPRVFGYRCVATDQQRDSGIGLDEQQVKIEARCLEKGWTLERVFTDASVSGSIPLEERPAGGQLLKVRRPGDVVIAAKLDRCLRGARDALNTIEQLKHRHVSLWVLDLPGDVSGNGISELVLTILAAVSRFERSLISDRTKEPKANLCRAGKHPGGSRPSRWRFGPERPADERNRSRVLIADPAEQQAIRDMAAMRGNGHSLIEIRDAMRARGFQISHQSVSNILARVKRAGGFLRATAGGRPGRAGAATRGNVLGRRDRHGSPHRRGRAAGAARSRARLPTRPRSIPLADVSQDEPMTKQAMPETLEDELYRMVNIYPADSGLPMTVWAGPRGNARHDVRVKVNMAHGNRMSISNTAVVVVRPMPRLISGQLSARDMQAVIDWLKLNEVALVEHWEGRISGVELGRRLQRL